MKTIDISYGAPQTYTVDYEQYEENFRDIAVCVVDGDGAAYDLSAYSARLAGYKPDTHLVYRTGTIVANCIHFDVSQQMTAVATTTGYALNLVLISADKRETLVTILFKVKAAAVQDADIVSTDDINVLDNITAAQLAEIQAFIAETYKTSEWAAYKTAASDAQGVCEDKAREVSTNATAAAAASRNAAESASAASTSASQAADSATAACQSETDANTAKTDAQAARDAAITARTGAETAKTGAETARTGAETARTGAQTAETNACTYATSAGSSAADAAASATTAAGQAEIATQKEEAAAISKSDAEGAAIRAKASESATDAAKTAAASSASAAGLSATAAANWAGLVSAANNHRNIYRGKSLGTSVTEAQKTAISSATFDDLFIGDYWTIGGIQWVIADMDYWYRCGEMDFKNHHLVIVPATNLYDAQMNATNTTDGGYAGSLMYTEKLASAKATIAAAFSSMVLTHSEYLVNAVTNGAPSAGAWFNSTVELMNELMVYGSYIHTPGSNGSTVVDRDTTDKTQLALFCLNPKAINIRANYWLRDVVSSVRFAMTDVTGSASYFSASNALGVRPAFAIG